MYIDLITRISTFKTQVETTWGLESQFVVEQLQSVFGNDALTSTHAMSYDVWTPTEIRGIFDTISYAKAASVIRMMEKSFGSTLYNNALHDYLEARYNNIFIFLCSLTNNHCLLITKIIEPERTITLPQNISGKRSKGK